MLSQIISKNYKTIYFFTKTFVFFGTIWCKRWKICSRELFLRHRFIEFRWNIF